jgi:hypothetical protein
MSKLENLIASAFLLGLSGCGDTINKNYYHYESDVKQQDAGGKYEDHFLNEDIPTMKDVIPDLFIETCSGELNDSLFEGETKSYVLENGNKYSIGLLFTDGETCKFSINGEETGKIKEKESYASPSGTKICVLEILYQPYAGGMHRCGFAFSGGEDVADKVIESTDVITGTDAPYDKVTDSKPSIGSGYECGNLSWYPDFFQTEGIFNGYFVVGEEADSVDNLAMTDIATSMWYTNDSGELEQIKVIDATKLDSEIADAGAQNLIVIGSPCVNTITASLLGNPADCTGGFSPGTAKLIMLQNNETENLAMIVAGYTSGDTRMAGKFLAYKWKEIQEVGGCEVKIETARMN